MGIFAEELILLNQSVSTKDQCLKIMINTLFEHGVIEDKDDFYRAVYSREDSMTTGIGRGLAIPHGRSNTVKKLSCALMTLKEPVDYAAIDDEPVEIIFMLAIPDESNNEYMKILAQISKFMREITQRNQLLGVSIISEAFDLLKGIEDEI